MFVFVVLFYFQFDVMTMKRVDGGSTQTILNFLKPNEAAKLAQTCKSWRNSVVRNACTVLWQGNVHLTEDCEYTTFRGRIEKFTTKERAMKRFNIMKGITADDIFFVKIYHFEAPIGWVATRPEWTIEWKKKVRLESTELLNY